MVDRKLRWVLGIAATGTAVAAFRPAGRMASAPEAVGLVGQSHLSVEFAAVMCLPRALQLEQALRVASQEEVLWLSSQ